MSDIDPEEDNAAIEEQLKALEEEKELLDDELKAGNISEREHKKAVSSVKFREAQLRERNQVTVERTQQTLTRDQDRFSD